MADVVATGIIADGNREIHSAGHRLTGYTSDLTDPTAVIVALSSMIVRPPCPVSSERGTVRFCV